MACNDRQLTEAQRQAGFGQQRSGVNRAIRPFSGSQTLENLIDYVNRELGPAVRATRDACNDVFLQVADNAPSANPLAFYFSTSTAAADPTVGRMRLDQAVQNTATVIRVSESNGRLQSVQPWLDVMSGGPTTPLGTLTMVDAINPGRFLRFDLNTMTDQGAYWDLGVTIIESSDTNPFVEDEPVVIGFIAGVSAAGSTVPVGSLSPVARDTFLGNIGTTTAPPAAVPLANVDSTSIVYDGTAHEFQRAALTSEVTAAQNVNALVITRSTGFQTSPWTGIHQFNNELRLGTLHTEASATGAVNITLTAGATRVLISSTGNVTLGSISGGADGRVLVIEHERASGTGVVTIPHSTTSNFIACPDAPFSVILGHRCGLTLVCRGTVWRVVGVAKSGMFPVIQTDAGGGGNDFALADATDILLVTANATYTGFARASGNNDGDRFFLQCDAGITARLPFNSGSSTTGNKISGQNAVEYVVGSRGLVQLIYRAQLWRIVSLGNEGRLIARTTYTSSSGTHTYDVRCRRAKVRMKGGGGGGGGAGAADGNVGGGGGEGGYEELDITTVPTSSAYAVGAAGTAGASTPAPGTAGGTGGDTTFNDGSVTRTAHGGVGGGVGGSYAEGGDGGAVDSIGGTVALSCKGAPGQVGNLDTTLVEGYGGNGGGSGAGKGGFNTTASEAGQAAGTNSGAGGGGGSRPASPAVAGAAGGAGWIIVEEFS